jgi:anti-sigma B factor antagonist
MKVAHTMENIVIVPLPERVDSATSPSVEASIMAKLHPGARVIVDGGAVIYMSAAGVRVLASTLHHAEKQHSRMVFCNFSGAAADCLLVSGFGELFEVADSIAQAEERLRPKPAGDQAGRLHPRGAAG